jgi:hypothetical protein
LYHFLCLLNFEHLSLLWTFVMQSDLATLSEDISEGMAHMMKTELIDSPKMESLDHREFVLTLTRNGYNCYSLNDICHL